MRAGIGERTIQDGFGEDSELGQVCPAYVDMDNSLTSLKVLRRVRDAGAMSHKGCHAGGALEESGAAK